MAGASFFALLDDIASLLDDVSAMSKVAIHNTAGVLGDDLALNAQQVTGFAADRELPVIWRIARGSGINKVILIPLAIALSLTMPWAILPLLMLGGIYLCYEGVEKIAHAWLHPNAKNHEARVQAVLDPDLNMVEFEKDRIRNAIRTDFILSAEIIVITLGTVRSETFLVQLGVLCAIGVIMTIGVYGLVAAIVKLDDLGMRWLRRKGTEVVDRMLRGAGGFLLRLAPFLLRFLSIAGTAAMFLVGGGIVTHNVPALHHFSEHAAGVAGAVPGVGFILEVIGPLLFDALFGILMGAIALAIVLLVKRVFLGGSHASAPQPSSN